MLSVYLYILTPCKCYLFKNFILTPLSYTYILFWEQCIETYEYINTIFLIQNFGGIDEIQSENVLNFNNDWSNLSKILD